MWGIRNKKRSNRTKESGIRAKERVFVTWGIRTKARGVITKKRVFVIWCGILELRSGAI